MKTIAELQQELRKTRQELAKIDERLSCLDDELMSFKEASFPDTKYERIFKLAESMPIIRHPVVSLAQEDKSAYLGILLMAATLEDSISDNQLLFFQRLIMSDPYRRQIDIYIGNIGKIMPENIMFMLPTTITGILADELILDLLLIVNLGNHCTVRSYSLIADIATLLNRSHYDIEKSMVCAKAILTQQLPWDDTDVDEVFEICNRYGYYTQHINGWEEKFIGAARKSLLKCLVSVALKN
jgi:hypothetical protein